MDSQKNSSSINQSFHAGDVGDDEIHPEELLERLIDHTVNSICGHGSEDDGLSTAGQADLANRLPEGVGEARMGKPQSGNDREAGERLFGRMLEHVSTLLPVPNFGRIAVYEMISVIVSERLHGGVWKQIDRERWLDWIVDRCMSSPATERQLRVLWGSVCQQIQNSKN